MSTLSSDTIPTDDGRGLHIRRWGPSDSQFKVMIVHGLGEHSGCYEMFGQAMADHGIATLAYDQHGHGKSPGRRGHAGSLEQLVDDLQTVHSHAAVENPDAEFCMLGHSMGGHLVLRFLLDPDRPSIDRAVVTNPMILPKNPPTKMQSLAAWITAQVLPRVRMSSDIDPQQVTRDVEVLADLRDDPLMHEQLSLGIGGELMSSGHAILDAASQNVFETSNLLCRQAGVVVPMGLRDAVISRRR